MLAGLDQPHIVVVVLPGVVREVRELHAFGQWLGRAQAEHAVELAGLLGPRLVRGIAGVGLPFGVRAAPFAG